MKKKKIELCSTIAMTRNFPLIYIYSRNNAGNNLNTTFLFHAGKSLRVESLEIIFSQ